MLRRLLIVVFVSFFLASFVNAERDPAVVEVVIATDLQADGKLAAKRRIPLLLMFSMRGCTYCEIVEEDFLRPMLLSGEYDDKVIIRMLMTDGYETVKDFNGQEIEASELASKYDASFTPTVIFVNAQGALVADRLIGLTTPDFYGGDLDDQIEVALRRIQTIRVAHSSVLK